MNDQQPWRPDYGPNYQPPTWGAPADAPGAYSEPAPLFRDGIWPNQPADTVGYPTPTPPQEQPRRKKPTVLIVLGCLAALVIAAVGYLLTGGSSPSPTAAGGPTAHGSLTTLWAAGGTAGVKLEDFSGSWATGDLIIDARVDGAIGYALSNGEQKWGWQTPAGDDACAMSAGTSDGIGVIAYGNTTGRGDTEACDRLVALNVETGRVLWTKNLDPVASNGYSYVMVSDPYITISGQYIAVEVEDEALAVYNLTSGAPHWQTPGEIGELNSCDPDGLQILDSSLYELSTCPSSTSSDGTVIELQAYPLHAASAQNPTTLSAPGLSEDDDPELWSAGGWLLAVQTPGISASTVLAYDIAAGETTPTTLTLSGYDNSSFATSADGQLDPRGWAVAGDTLYVADQEVEGHAGIAALSLKTGRQQWNQTLGGTSDSTVIDADTSGVEVVTGIGQQTGYELVHLAAATGAAVYGPGTPDQRFFIDTGNSTLYIEGRYLVNLEVMTVGGTPGVVVLSGVTG